MVGGQSVIQAEVFSPNGNCDINLTPIRDTLFTPTLAYIDDKIIACSASRYDQQYCWQYSVSKNNWTAITSFPYSFSYPRGVVHNDKIYIIDDINPAVFDPRNNSWSTWPKPLQFSSTSCLVSFKDSILVIGGYVNPQLVQSFNSTLNTWSILKEGAPFALHDSSCILLPTNKVLVVAVMENNYVSAVYDIGANFWDRLQDTKNNRYGATFVNLNDRIFLIGGKYQKAVGYLVEEFHYIYNTWTEVDASPINPQTFSSALALPAHIFAHLPSGCEE
jgi:hypothetical protein